MSLNREEFENHGGAFSAEDFRPGSDPDQPHFFADLTVDGHTVTFQGKSVDDVLAQAEQVLRERGRLEEDDEPEVASLEQGENQPSASGILASHPQAEGDDPEE